MSDIIPLQRLGESKDIADSCIFMASPAASYITGITIQVSGGLHLTASNFPFFNQDFLTQYAKKTKL